MKLAVTVLASILFACSVTTAKPVNPSAAASAEASTSTVIPSATKSTKSKHHVLSYKGSTFSVDLSKFSKDDVELFEEYLEADQEYQEAKKACDSAKSEELNQRELSKRLSEESYELSLEYLNNRDDPEYQEKREIISQKIREGDKKFFSLQEKRLKLDKDFCYADHLLHLAAENLADLLFKNGPNATPVYSQIEFLKSNPSFVEGIYQSLILQLNKQSGSKKASTSGTQNKSKHHKSPLSSSKRLQINPLKHHPVHRQLRPAHKGLPDLPDPVLIHVHEKLPDLVLVHGKLIPK
ncbi:hypothetical protein O5D80_003507 [Batrachochytrium dendrobatidis]|nr:hypothetical protein O5D80_003507 [Batrachochytrium dendrobatidis]